MTKWLSTSDHSWNQHFHCLVRVERSTDQVIKPVNVEALSKWVGKIPADVVRDMAVVAPMLSRLGYDPHANPPNYGRPDPKVLDNTRRVSTDQLTNLFLRMITILLWKLLKVPCGLSFLFCLVKATWPTMELQQWSISTSVQFSFTIWGPERRMTHQNALHLKPTIIASKRPVTLL